MFMIFRLADIRNVGDTVDGADRFYLHMTAQGACSFFTAVRRFGRLFGDRPRAIEMRALFAALPAIATFFVMMISIKLVQSIVAVGQEYQRYLFDPYRSYR